MYLSVYLIYRKHEKFSMNTDATQCFTFPTLFPCFLPIPLPHLLACCICMNYGTSTYILGTLTSLTPF